MEQRKSINLITLLLRYAGFCIASILGTVFLWWLVLSIAINSGFVMSANSAERAASEAASKLRESGVFRADLVPSLCDYVFFDKSGEITATSVGRNKKALEKAINFKERGYNSPDRYHILVELKDGVCVLQYTFKMPYASERLRSVLPDFQMLSIGISLLTVVMLLAGITGHYVGVFKRQLKVLEEAAIQLKDGDLESDFARSGIKEYDRVLNAMEQLKAALKESLLEQWDMEHSLIAQTTALTHDLKTPLTVIDGNGQLLEETELTAEQQQCLEAIMRNVQAAQEYVGTLNWLSANRGTDSSQKENIEGAWFKEKVMQTAREICRVYGKQIEFTFDELPKLYLKPKEVLRAAANMTENAAAYSRTDLAIKLTLKWQVPYLYLTVEDSGPGFTKQALENGTKLFYTENISRTQNKHKGIGLAFAKSVAQQHQGKLILENTAAGHGKVSLSLKVEEEWGKE